jgi:hypothetical protein
MDVKKTINMTIVGKVFTVMLEKKMQHNNKYNGESYGRASCA